MGIRFVTSIYNYNVLSKISGHAAGSKEFYKYVAVVQDYLNAKVRNAFDRLVDDKF